MWNILHPRYHRLDDFYNENGIIENCFVINIWRHMLRHMNKGKDKCNFNIILPGADFIMGTYKGCVDNSKLCNSNNKLTKEEIDLCAKQKVMKNCHMELIIVLHHLFHLHMHRHNHSLLLYNHYHLHLIVHRY